MNNEVYGNFSKLLHERLALGTFTTEDSIRYTFFAALLSSTAIKPHNVILEFPHPAIDRAMVDVYIPQTITNPEVIIEFKYHRQNPGGKNSNRTQQAGDLLKDIHRLQLIKLRDSEVNRILIYVTDEEMNNYLGNKNNGLYDFYHLNVDDRMQINKDYINTKSDTFRKAVGLGFEATVKCEYKCSLLANHYLRIYSVS